MESQIIVSIGRQYGSGGHIVAKLLAQKLGIPVYGKDLLREASGGVLAPKKSKIEGPTKPFFTKLFGGSYAQNMAELQFALLKAKVADDDSFVIVGRCADDLFRGREGFISIFITADMNDKINRIKEKQNFSEKMAIKAIEKFDKSRAFYHDHFSKGGKWGQSSNYDLCINVSRLGIEGTAEFLYDYVLRRLGRKVI